MSKFAGYDIKFEVSDEKGMINGNAMINFLQKAIKAVCEICISTNKFGSGFFCKIPYTQNNNLLLPVLITNNHVLSKNELESDLKIKINGETKIISLKGRKKWTDETIDFTCIEIKEEEDNIHTFFNLDDNVLDKNYSNDCYLNHHVIIFAINKNDKQVGFSNGVIKQNEKSFFAYTCNTFPGCSGGCIVNQNNNNIIGIHKGEINTSNEKAVNAGIYINNVINYIKQSKEKISEKVNIIL
jgi:hypothetical protein